MTLKRPRGRRFIGFAPDDLPLPIGLTGREFLLLHDRLRGIDTVKSSTELAEIWQIDDSLDRLVSEYSHGMKRKLQVIAALAHRPRLLILDEPFRGLDPESVVLMRTLMRQFAAAGAAVVVATHDMMRSEVLCDRVLIMSGGEAVARECPADLRAEHGAADLEGVFLEATGANQGHSERRDALLKLLTD